ncbi:MAG: hypothetical protein H0T65_09095, partial [Deltaproteobacteria bacterium]|nr:hypothetical protein [Deltaproteobacteria bacterium]
MRCAAVIAILLLATSCSFVFTSGPKSGPARSYPDCTSSMAWPIIDGVFTALFLTATITAIASDDKSSTSFDDDDSEASKAAQITSSALFTAAAGVSAYVGYRRVSRCRHAREQFLAQYPQGMQPYAQPYPQPYAQPYPQPYPAQQQQPYPQPYPAQQQPAPLPAPEPNVPTALGTEGDV